MWFLLLAIVVSASVYLTKKMRKRKPNIDLAAELAEIGVGVNITAGAKQSVSVPSIRIDASREQKDTRTIEYKKQGESVYNIGTNLPISLTLSGIAENEVLELVSAISKNNLWEIREWLHMLVAKNNIKCLELSEWVEESKSKIYSLCKSHLEESKDWKDAGDLDKNDMLKEFRKKSIEELASRPANTELAYTLLFEEPTKLSENIILREFKDNLQSYKTLMYSLSHGRKVQVVSSDDYRRSSWEHLHSAGYALRGTEIPINDILETLTLKALQEIAGSEAPKKFTRKNQAIEFVKNLSDLKNRLDKAIAFRELFQIKEIEGLDPKELVASFEYSSTVADLILDTFRSCLENLEEVESFESDLYLGLVLVSDNCSPSCKKMHSKKWKSVPKNIPPFHIGCEASIQNIFDN